MLGRCVSFQLCNIFKSEHYKDLKGFELFVIQIHAFIFLLVKCFAESLWDIFIKKRNCQFQSVFVALGFKVWLVSMAPLAPAIADDLKV